MLAVVGTIIGVAWTVFALAPWLWLAIAMNVFITGAAALLVPGIFAALSLAIPPKVRSMGFAMAALFIVPGLLALYIVGGIADTYGIRAGLLIVVPIFLIGAWVLASGSMYVKNDINRVWTSTAAQAEVMLKRQQGEVKLLLVRNVDVHYDGVQVLFHVNFEVDEGEIVALLGTNGAGKSTLLKTDRRTRAGDERRGRVRRPRHDLRAAERGRGPRRRAVPGRPGVFPTLSVGEHLRLASWLHRKRQAARRGRRRSTCSSCSRCSRDRLDEPAGNLSGGQQQMLALGHGLHRTAAAADDRRAVARARAGDRRAAAADRARHLRAGHDDHPRRAVGEPRAHDRRARVLHGEGRDPLQRPDRASCSSGPTCCARCSSKAPRRAWRPRHRDRARDHRAASRRRTATGTASSRCAFRSTA